MLNNVMNATLHPVSSLGMVEWMLWRWQMDSTARLLIILPNQDGDKTVNRLRVTLSRIRAALRKAGVTDIQHFGIKTHVGGWTELTGERYDALYVSRFVEKSHTMSEIFASMDFGFKKKDN